MGRFIVTYEVKEIKERQIFDVADTTAVTPGVLRAADHILDEVGNDARLLSVIANDMSDLDE